MALASIAASRLPDDLEWEALVIDNNSTDNTREVVQDFCQVHPRFRYIFEPQQGLSHARNTGIRKANGEVIAFVDDDVTVDADWLRELTTPFEGLRWAGAGGKIRAENARELPKWVRLEGPFSMGGSMAALFDRGDEPGELREPPYGTNMAYRKQVFERYGYFRTDLGRSSNNMIGKEDTEFGNRLLSAGEHLWYAPSAVVFHPILPERLTKKYFLRWWFGCGQSMIREQGVQPGKWGIPRYVLTSGMVAASALRWVRTVNPAERFFWKCWTWMYAGKTLENYRQSDREKARKPSTGQTQERPEDDRPEPEEGRTLAERTVEVRRWPEREVTGIVRTGKTKRILFVTRTFEYGGAEKHLIDLLYRMRQPDLQLTVLCFAADPFTERVSPDPNLIVRSLPKVPTSLREWVSLFRAATADTVVFVHAWSWNLDWIAPVGAWLARVPHRFAIQHLVTSENPKRTLLNRIRRRVLGHPNLTISSATLDKTICVSDAVRQTLIDDYGFSAPKMKTIHNGVSLSQFVRSPEDGTRIREEFGVGPEEFLLICVARLTEQKGINILLAAIAQTLKKGSPCKCIIVGDGPLREQLLRQHQQLALHGRVMFAGFRDDIRPYLHAASAFILTSYTEGLPLAILEAMACGLPCIVTDVGGNREAVTDKITGLLIPAGSVDSATEAISCLASDPERRAQMSRAALLRVRQEFDIEACMAQIKSLIVN
jgi:glucosyl-dolichyl phosphate glucuronosyltransferase